MGVIHWDSYDPELEKFVDEHIDSFIVWGLFVFLYHNPGIRDSAEGLARRLGRKISDLSKHLDELTEKKILKCIEENDQKYYVYEPPSEIESKINTFVKAIENRDTRLHILTRVLRKQ